MTSVSADPTFAPRPLVISNILQYKVVEFDDVCVLIAESVDILDEYLPT